MKKSPLKVKSSLRTKTSLKTRSPLKVTKKSKQKTPKWTVLRRKADIWFSRYVRLRDSYYEDGMWFGNCITSDKKLLVIDAEGKWQKSANIGHYISRGCYGLRYDEENCNLQSAYDNAWRDKLSMLQAYSKALDDKYGTGTAKRLQRASKSVKRPTIKELEIVISDSQEYIKYTLSHADNYQPITTTIPFANEKLKH